MLKFLSIAWAVVAGFIASVMLIISPVLAMGFDRPGAEVAATMIVIGYFLVLLGFMSTIPAFIYFAFKKRDS